MLTVGELCAGIGGIGRGLEATGGFRVAWHSEIEDYPCRVLERHWPSVPNHGDMKLIDYGAVERVDLIAGGIPCQPFSLAGKRGGASDSRNLWPEFVRALVFGDPRMALVENVAGLLNIALRPGGGYFALIIRQLLELGYSVEWGIISAQMVGAPHRRERVFIFADRRPMQPAGTCFAELERDYWIAPAGRNLFPTTAGERKYRGRWPRYGRAVGVRAYALPELEGTCATETSWRSPQADDRTRSDSAYSYRRQEQGKPLTLSMEVAMRSAETPLWPTPRSSPNENRSTGRTPSQEAGKHGKYLASEAAETHKLYPTPQASDGEKGGPNQRHGSGDQPLPGVAAQLWSTPSTMEHLPPREGQALERVLRRGEPNGSIRQSAGLRQEAHELVSAWPTPSSSDNRDRGRLQNPCIQRRIEKGKQIDLGMLAQGVGQQIHESLPAPSDQPSGTTGGQLNPSFVEALQGFPPEFTAI